MDRQTNNYLRIAGHGGKPEFVFLDDRHPERVEAAVAEARYLALSFGARIIAYRLTEPLRRAGVVHEVGKCRLEDAAAQVSR